jgi:branched-chain amino acid transport system permease protein
VRAPAVGGPALLGARSASGIGNYPLHLVISCLLWGYVYTSWSIMGRLGLVSFGHGAFSASALIRSSCCGTTSAFRRGSGDRGIVVSMRSRSRSVSVLPLQDRGHYFALVTLALSEVTRLVIVALRDQTGGSLGATPNTALAQGVTISFEALQFQSKIVWFYIILACWLAVLWVWHLVDRSMTRIALEAISQEEDAAASIGINVTKSKLFVTLISATMTSIGGFSTAQYQLYINPETVSGIGYRCRWSSA